MSTNAISIIGNTIAIRERPFNLKGGGGGGGSYLDGNEITTKEDAIHLGIIRSEKNEYSKNIEAGFPWHKRYRCCNLLQNISHIRTTKINIWTRSLTTEKNHVENLESFHRKSIRYLQSLPQRIATAAIYLLVGVIPIEAELHKRKLSLLYSMLASDNLKIKEIINRQISVNYDEDSFFCNIRDILILYDLPSTNV